MDKQLKLYEKALIEATQRAEQAEATSRAKSEFLATLSHKLRIPLTSIIGMAQLLNIDCLLPGQHEQVQDILKAGEHLLSLVDELLEVGKLEAGGFELEQLPFDLFKLLEETVNMLSFQAKAKGVQLLINYDKNAPTQVISDLRIIRQIILNLIVNALKFTERGSITIKVTCQQQGDHQANFAIMVEDTGIGLTQDKIADILASQNDSSSRRYKNKGLGLSISMAYLKVLKGTLKIQSQLGRGSIFTCMIPLDLQDIKMEEQIEKKQISYKIVPIVSDKQIRVLLVEDDAMIQRVHKPMLERLGCNVDLAANASEAYAMYEQGYDLIFMDVGLPEVSGIEITQHIRQQEILNSKHTPIIGLTGYGHPEDRDNCLNAGMDEVAIKPVRPDELKEIIEHWVLPTSLLQIQHKASDLDDH